MTTKTKTILTYLILCLISFNLLGQSITGNYKSHIQKKFKLFGLLPHFRSSGFLILDPDSTYNAESNWESFSSSFNGNWKLYNDTLILYSDGNDLFGEEKEKHYAYSYGHSDAIKNEIIFGIYDLSAQKIPHYKGVIYSKNSEKTIEFNSDGIFKLQDNYFDSLVIETDKYFKYQKIKITLPVCCKVNNFGITPGIRYFLIQNKKIKSLKGQLLTKKNNTCPNTVGIIHKLVTVFAFAPASMTNPQCKLHPDTLSAPNSNPAP